MPKIIIDEQELFKIQVFLEKASSAFAGLICALDGCFLDEDEELISEVGLNMTKCEKKLKRLIDFPVEASS